MPRLDIPLQTGLRFGKFNAQGEKALDASFTTKLNTLASRKKHAVRFSVPAAPRKILQHNEINAIFSLTTDGRLLKNNAVVDTGYSTTDGALLSMVPSNTVSSPYIWIAGGSKMTKDNGDGSYYKWGIAAPPDNAVNATFLGNIASQVINNCDDATTWTASGCTVANEATIKQSGTNSLRVALTPNNTGTITSTFGSIVLSTRPIISFDIRVSDPAALRTFSIFFDLINDGFINSTAHRDFGQAYTPVMEGQTPVSEIIASNPPDETSGEEHSHLVDYSQVSPTTLPSIANQWKLITVARDTFQLVGTGTWSTVYGIRIVMLSTATQNIYIDLIAAGPRAMDDIQGTRYKYAYRNNLTGNRSNLNLFPSTAVRGQNGSVQINGFQQPTDPQITHIELYRDVGQNGNYQFVTDTTVPAPWGGGPTITDSVSVRDLGDVDLNDNAPPPFATQAIEFLGRVWMNDMNNPYRIWRSSPGKPEGFSLQVQSGFFDLIEAKSPVVGFAVLREQFYIITKQQILQVVGDDSAPSFLPAVEIGAINSNSYYVAKDFIALAHLIGMFTFDGANLRELPEIGSLFDPQVNDDRCINQVNIETCVVGSDNRHIWLSYTDKMNVARQFCYVVEQIKWIEESVILKAHNEVHLEFAHIAADGSNVYNIYGGVDYEKVDFKSQIVELASSDVSISALAAGRELTTTRPLPIGHFRVFGLEYLSNVALTVTIFANGTSIDSFAVPSSAFRRWFYRTLDLLLGQFIQIEIVAQAQGLVELYLCSMEYNELETTLHFNSEFIRLTDQRAVVVELHPKIFAVEDGTVNFKLLVDDKLLEPKTLVVDKNTLSSQRIVLPPTVGSTIRLDIDGTRFSPVGLTIKAIELGSGEIKSVAIPTRS
jgi:hypothetical protein